MNNDRKIDDTLNSLQGIHSAEPKPFLITRVHAAINQNNTEGTWYTISSFLKKPVVAFFALMIILLVNVFILMSAGNNVDTIESTVKNSGSLQEDFALSITGVYDIEP